MDTTRRVRHQIRGPRAGSIRSPMQSVPGPRPPAGVVVPIRAFTSGMARLAAVLNDHDRIRLATTMATRVVAAAGPLPVVIVSSASEVGTWAEASNLVVVPDPGTGLDDAVAAGCAEVRGMDLARVIVAHADLPRARPASLTRFATLEPGIVTIVPCHRDDGTPVISLPAAVPFPFAYGPDSARRHAAIARRAGLAVRIVRDSELGYDVDIPEDLSEELTFP